MPRCLRALSLLVLGLALARSAWAVAPTITIEDPNDGDVVNSSPLQVAGTFTGDNVTITVNGVDATVDNTGWTATIPVTALGPFTITAVATNDAEETATASITVTSDVPVTITIEAPSDGDLVHGSPLQVAGKFTGVNVTVTVNGVDATVINTGWLANIPVTAVGPFTITAVATDDAEETATASITVTADVPVIHIETPADGFVTGDKTVDVSGFVEDNGFDPNAPTTFPTLRVNGIKLDVDPDGSFAGRVPIGPGENAVRFVAQDPQGNVATNTEVTGTRTTVCDIGVLPEADPNDPNKPRLFRVNRLDDLPLPTSFDPNLPADFNDPNGCDIRPPIVRHDPNDPNGPPLPGFQPPIGKCTLRAALQLANAHPGVDLIELPNGIIKLTRKGDGDVRGDLDVTDDVAIGGLGRDVSEIDGRKLKDRVFDVAPGVSFTLINASLRGGQTPKKSTESGGCLRFAGGISLTDPNRLATLKGNDLALLDCKSGADGGALAVNEAADPNDPNFPAAATLDPNDPNAASVSSLTCTIIARSSAKKDGGGLLLDGASLRLRNSTIARTSSGADGGAIANRGRLLMTNATISTNKAKKSGGGLAVASGADTKLNNVTFAQNKAKQGMSLSASDPNGVVASNSILGDKAKATCSGPVTSQGGNVDPGGTCGLGDDDQPNDQANTLPKLDKLATNVGVPTHALQFDSPAIDHGLFATCEPLDERDTDRVDGPPEVDTNPPDPDKCDAGAFEFASTPDTAP